MQGLTPVALGWRVAAFVLVGAAARAASPAWGGFIPGGGSERSDCYTQLYVGGIESPGPQVKRRRIVSCVDGDPCDNDRGARSVYGGPGCGNNVCEFEVAVCVGQTDPDLPACTPVALRDMSQHVRRLGVPGRDFQPDYIPRRVLFSNAFPWEKRAGSPSCGQSIGMDVHGRVTEDGRMFPGRLEISLEAIGVHGSRPERDRDTIVLECLPRTTPCPDLPPPTTTTTLPEYSTRPTVIVAAGGGVRFDPATVRIRAGDTVRWVWAGSGYDLTSGPSYPSDGLFCYPSCDSHPAVDHVLAGAVFEHTFPEPGTFDYKSTNSFVMRGRVVVEP